MDIKTSRRLTKSNKRISPDASRRRNEIIKKNLKPIYYTHKFNAVKIPGYNELEKRG